MLTKLRFRLCELTASTFLHQMSVDDPAKKGGLLTAGPFIVILCDPNFIVIKTAEIHNFDFSTLKELLVLI